MKVWPETEGVIDDYDVDTDGGVIIIEETKQDQTPATSTTTTTTKASIS